MNAIAERIITPTTIRSVAFTPDSDDVFMFYGWEHDKVGRTAAPPPSFHRHHVVALNRAALVGEYDVSSISSVAFLGIADDYHILSAGTSVGRGYGPVLVARHYEKLAELRGKRIAVGGLPSTGGMLAQLYCPSATIVEAPYNTIAAGISSGEFDAGVMIHEELVFFPKLGLQQVEDLGARWSADHDLPIPVGLNVAHKRLGIGKAQEACRFTRESLAWSWGHFDEARAFASTFGRGCADRFVRMFANTDSFVMPADVRAGLALLLEQAANLGYGPRLSTLEVLHG